MDYRDRKYYCVAFDWKSLNMRIKNLNTVTDGKVKFHNGKDKYRHGCTYMISVPKEYSEAVEYELRKAERNDDYCYWREVEEWKN